GSKDRQAGNPLRDGPRKAVPPVPGEPGPRILLARAPATARVGLVPPANATSKARYVPPARRFRPDGGNPATGRADILHGRIYPAARDVDPASRPGPRGEALREPHGRADHRSRGAHRR